jgi:hypothetical protein
MRYNPPPNTGQGKVQVVSVPKGQCLVFSLLVFLVFFLRYCNTCALSHRYM